MIRALAMSVALAFLAGATAHAQEDEETPEDVFSRNGWYVGAYGVYALENYRDTDGLDFDDSPGANVRFGYRGYEWFALEAEVEWIHSFDAHDSGKVESRTIIGGVNGRFYPPLGGRFQPYAIVGFNGMNVDIDHKGVGPDHSETDWGIRGGLGLDIYATRHIVVGIEGTYVWGLGDVWENDYGSVGAGILYRF